MIRNMKKVVKVFCAALLTASVATAVTGSPVHAARMGSASASVPETSSDFPDPRLPDPHKDLRQVIGSILEERTREMRLLLDVDLSQDLRNMLVTIVINNSNAQIESLLRSKQKTKFDQELMQAQRLR
jgi:hypothetical protein